MKIWRLSQTLRVSTWDRLLCLFPLVREVEESEFMQGGSTIFLAGARDIAKGKDRSEDEKSEVKPTR